MQTESPKHVNAAKLAASEMKSWGFDNTALEAWDFGHPGWVNELNMGMMLSPVQDALTFEVLAWTPSSEGMVKADAVHLVTPTFPSPTNPNAMQGPTQEELTAYLDGVKASVRGKIVLVGKPTFIDQANTPAAKRIADEDNKRRYDADAAARVGGGGPGGPGGGRGAAPPTRRPGAL